MKLLPMFTAVSLLTLAACDQGSDDATTLREKVDAGLSEASLSLSEAIDLAQAQHPSATVVEAGLDVEHEALVYDVELYAEGVEYEVYVDAGDGSIARDREEALEADDAAERQAAADLVIASSGWADLIAAAEAAAGATAFDVEADGDDGVLEVEALSDAGIHEVELSSDGTVVKSELSDDEAWELEKESESEDDDDDEVDNESEDPNDSSNDDG